MLPTHLHHLQDPLEQRSVMEFSCQRAQHVSKNKKAASFEAAQAD